MHDSFSFYLTFYERYKSNSDFYFSILEDFFGNSREQILARVEILLLTLQDRYYEFYSTPLMCN